MIFTVMLINNHSANSSMVKGVGQNIFIPRGFTDSYIKSSVPKYDEFVRLQWFWNELIDRNVL